jgi:hypothetical protein
VNLRRRILCVGFVRRIVGLSGLIDAGRFQSPQQFEARQFVLASSRQILPDICPQP